MVDFLNWPVLHLVSVVNAVGIAWTIKELITIKRDLAFLQGSFEERKQRRD
jgi:hypothetical protein